jgi:hypothetical protein
MTQGPEPRKKFFLLRSWTRWEGSEVQIQCVLYKTWILLVFKKNIESNVDLDGEGELVRALYTFLGVETRLSFVHFLGTSVSAFFNFIYYAFPFKCLVLVNYIAYRKEIAKRMQTAIFTNSFLLQIVALF